MWAHVFQYDFKCSRSCKVQSCEFSITVIYRMTMTAMYHFVKICFSKIPRQLANMSIVWGCRADEMLWYYYHIWFHRSPAALDPWYALPLLPVLFGITTYVKIIDSFTPRHLRLWYKTDTIWIAKSGAGRAVLNSPNHQMKFSKSGEVQGKL